MSMKGDFLMDSQQRMIRNQKWSLLILRFPGDKKNMWRGGLVFFFFNICAVCYSDIPNSVPDTKTDIQLLV